MKLQIYVKKQAGLVNGKFDKKTSKVLRSKMTMTKEYAKAFNQGYKNSGVYVELDSKATAKFEEAKAPKK
jgi:hypothetical protein